MTTVMMQVQTQKTYATTFLFSLRAHFTEPSPPPPPPKVKIHFWCCCKWQITFPCNMPNSPSTEAEPSISPSPWHVQQWKIHRRRQWDSCLWGSGTLVDIFIPWEFCLRVLSMTISTSFFPWVFHFQVPTRDTFSVSAELADVMSDWRNSMDIPLVGCPMPIPIENLNSA